jgi:hypothetical protein
LVIRGTNDRINTASAGRLPWTSYGRFESPKQRNIESASLTVEELGGIAHAAGPKPQNPQLPP